MHLEVHEVKYLGPLTFFWCGVVVFFPPPFHRWKRKVNAINICFSVLGNMYLTVFVGQIDVGNNFLQLKTSVN